MIKINLLPEAQQTTRRFETVSTGKGTNLGSILLIVFIIIGLLATGWRFYSLHNTKKSLNNRIAEAEAEIERLKPILEEVERFKKRKELLQKKLDLIQDLKANQKGPVHIMDELSDMIPEYLWLNKMILKGKSIKLTGGAMNPNEVAEFLKNLDDSPYFGEPTLKKIQERKNYYAFQCTVTFTFNPKKSAKAKKEAQHGS